MIRCRCLAALIALMAALGGCGDRPAVAAEVAIEPEAEAVEARRPGPFDEQVLEIAASYQSFTRVSEHASWAMMACAAPPPSRGVLQSTSDDTDTHGRKLYFMYAKDAIGYRRIGDPFTNPDAASWGAVVGQALVKESFVPVEVPSVEEPSPLDSLGGLKYPAEYLRAADGTFYKTGEPAGPFIMFKLDPETPGTDEGWVYAATSADGMIIHEAGRIESCMNCHQRAAHDRLFGLQ